MKIIDDWNERIAFNEGYAAERISSARQAGHDAFISGMDRAEGRDLYLSESVEDVGAVDDVGESDHVEVEASEPEDSGSWYEESMEDHYESVQYENDLYDAAHGFE